MFKFSVIKAISVKIYPFILNFKFKNLERIYFLSRPINVIIMLKYI